MIYIEILDALSKSGISTEIDISFALDIDKSAFNAGIELLKSFDYVREIEVLDKSPILYIITHNGLLWLKTFNMLKKDDYLLLIQNSRKIYEYIKHNEEVTKDNINCNITKISNVIECLDFLLERQYIKNREEKSRSREHQISKSYYYVNRDK